MENLPPIRDMYASMQQQRDYDVVRRYESTRLASEAKKSPTKKGSYLDDNIKYSCSPGPANKSNLQPEWARPSKQLLKYSNRRTYIDEINLAAKKRNSPSPNQYSLTMDWPRESKKVTHVSEKTNFLDNYEYESTRTPGPGTYLVATHIAKKTKEYHHTETKPLQPRKEISADMNTYDPVPLEYATFKSYEKTLKPRANLTKKQEPGAKKQRQNVSPGPGQYQMINTWEGKEKKPAKGSLTYLNKITKGPAVNIYYS